MKNVTATSKQKITPFLWFEKDAKKVGEFYVSVFNNSKINNVTSMGDTPSGTVEIVSLELFGQNFTLMSAGPEFKFTEAISFVIDCEDQEEVDHYWQKLAIEGGEEGNCGWLKDKYGVSWQVVPRQLNELMGDPDRVKAGKVQQAMLKMNKIDVTELQKAYDS